MNGRAQKLDITLTEPWFLDAGRLCLSLILLIGLMTSFLQFMGNNDFLDTL